MKITNSLIFIPENVKYITAPIIGQNQIRDDKLSSVSSFNPLKREERQKAEEKRIHIPPRRRRLEIGEETPINTSAAEPILRPRYESQMREPVRQTNERRWVYNRTQSPFIIDFGDNRPIVIKKVFDAGQLDERQLSDPRFTLLFDGDSPNLYWISSEEAKKRMKEEQNRQQEEQARVERLRQEVEEERDNRRSRDDVRRVVRSASGGGGDVTIEEVDMARPRGMELFVGGRGGSPETIDMTTDLMREAPPNDYLPSEVSSIFGSDISRITSRERPAQSIKPRPQMDYRQ